MIQITNTMIVVYSCIGILTVVAAYIYGYSRAQRNHTEKENALIQSLREYIDALEQGRTFRDELMEEMKVTQVLYKSIYDLDQKLIEMWKNKYTALQQEIECTLHETHEEVERPHVGQIWPVDRNVTSDWKEFGYKPQHHDIVFEDEDEAEILDSIYGKPSAVDHEWESHRREDIDDIHD